MNISVTYPNEFPLINLERSVFESQLKHLFANNYFNITLFKSIATKLNISYYKNIAYDDFQKLHCVDFKRMNEDLLKNLPLKISEFLGVNIRYEDISGISIKYKITLDQTKFPKELSEWDKSIISHLFKLTFLDKSKYNIFDYEQLNSIKDKINNAKNNELINIDKISTLTINNFKMLDGANLSLMDEEDVKKIIKSVEEYASISININKVEIKNNSIPYANLIDDKYDITDDEIIAKSTKDNSIEYVDVTNEGEYDFFEASKNQQSNILKFFIFFICLILVVISLRYILKPTSNIDSLGLNNKQKIELLSKMDQASKNDIIIKPALPIEINQIDKIGSIPSYPEFCQYSNKIILCINAKTLDPKSILSNMLLNLPVKTDGKTYTVTLNIVDN